jgi:hypothetical protein
MENRRPVSLEATYKSKDTEEWFDIKFNRPIGYAWALLFDKLGIHPNIVTIVSIVLGVFSAFCFYHTTLDWNILGIIVLVVANTLDSADGQLARMTGKKTLWGRLLDGFAGDIWFFTIYFCIGLRMMPQPMPFGIDANWGVWIWILMFFSGIISHKDQTGLADYYRNIYLMFKKDKSELNNSKELSAEQRSTPWRKWFWKIWLFFYQRYTIRQERCTPQFQQYMQALESKYGNNIPQQIGDEFCRRTFHLLKWTNILTFNTRAAVMFVSFLVDMPWIYFLFELTVLNVIYFYMKFTHENVCKTMRNELENE